MRLQLAKKIRARCLAPFTLLVAFAVATTGQLYAQQAEGPATTPQTEQDLAEQYRASVRERRTEIETYQVNVEHIDDAIRAVQDELAEENRAGRVKDLRSRLEQLREQRSALDEQIATEQHAISSADTAENAFYNVAREDLFEREEQRTKELDELDARIATLEAELNEQRGMQIEEKNLRRQIEELTRRRDELTNQPEIRSDDLAEQEAIEAAAATSFREAEAARREQLTSVRETIAQLERDLAHEDRRGRKKSIEAQIEKLKMREHELNIDPVSGRRAEGKAGDESLDVIQRGLKAEEMKRTSQVAVLDQTVAQLRAQFRAERRSSRRKSLLLQIRELEEQKKAVGKPEQVPLPPATGFIGAPYGSAWDEDSEYRPQE
jgi:hypothetical protein